MKRLKSSHNAPDSLDYDESFVTANPIPEAEGPHRSPPPSPGLLFESDDLFPPEYFWNYVSDSTEDHSAASAECFDLFMRTEENEEGEEKDKNEELEITEGLEEGAEVFEITDKTSLYAGAQINVMESVTSVLSFVQSEHISGVGLSRLLSLINLHLPQPNNFLKTNHVLFKVLEGVDEPVHMHHYCSHKKTRVKKNVNNIEDIFDGEVYKGAEARMMNENGITFTLNTDGVQIFKSNSYSLWPIYLVINELPPEKRFLSENLIIVGLWGSLQKPHPNLYVLPIYNELAPLKTGVEILVYGEENPQQICARITCSTCDAPATSQFMNMKSHSGFYSCPVCIMKGVKPGDSVVFPYEANVPLRSLEQYADNVKLAVQSKIILSSTVRNEHLYLGIRGPTILSSLLDNMLSSVAIDSMHCLYLGQMKQMLRLWFDDDFKKQPFSVFNKLAIVSQRIMDLAPPHFLQRLPQVLEKLVHWKASEFRSFLFYFSAILLRAVLKPDYFDHFLLFVQGVSLLNSSSISEEDLVLASSLLEQFVQKFEQLYGVNYMTHNLHMCMHLARCVKLLGPFWAYSCFQFEDINGRLTNFIHGTRHISLQIHSNLSVITQLPLMVNKLDEGVAKEYCKTIKRKYQMKISGVITPGVYCVKGVLEGLLARLFFRFESQIWSGLKEGRSGAGQGPSLDRTRGWEQ
ncbi:hypothetical protein FOCC_FOCC013216 [Frankliniella occidentalis]|nr:hypothetical protein FOCC_FOCC013216 [Frankliniella occidentalis]